MNRHARTRVVPVASQKGTHGKGDVPFGRGRWRRGLNSTGERRILHDESPRRWACPIPPRSEGRALHSGAVGGTIGPAGGVMAKRWARMVVSGGNWAAIGLLWGAGLLGGSWGCSAGGAAEPASEGSPAEPSRADEPLDPSRAEPDSNDVVYQFVDTPNGMTVEATSGGAVQTQSCPNRTCAGFCDECAVRACLALGQLTGACERLVGDCNRACTCGGIEVNGSNCGFPVCTTNRNLCYIGDGSSQARLPPAGPEPDPGDPASAPANGARGSTGADGKRPGG
jgi:hypothetical protein